LNAELGAGANDLKGGTDSLSRRLVFFQHRKTVLAQF
jgi:hypothetical protein